MKNENWLDKKVDVVRAKSMLSKERIKSEIVDPVKIEEKIIRAWKKFSSFINAKIRNSYNTAFSISFDAMAETLDLSTIPWEMAQNAMDQIVLSAPGITKSETGYTVSDPELLYENFGPNATQNKIMDIFSINPDKIYSSQEIAQEVKLTYNAVHRIVLQLVLEGKIIETKKEDFHGDPRQKHFKLA